MSIATGYRKLLFVSIAFLTFGVWFADGYLQWVNSDTAGEAWGSSQYVGFPHALISKQHAFHARITAASLAYLPFHTIGPLYRELTNDPVNALFVSQGIMTGTVYLLFVLISAAYVSFSAPILSARYLVSAALLMLFTMALPALPIDVPLNTPLSLTVRFFHQSVMTHYVGTMAIALFALFPYWRHLCTGKWDDWYSDVRLRIPFYVLIIAAVFSSTATMIWLGVVSGFALLWLTWHAAKVKNYKIVVRSFAIEIFRDSRVHPLLLIMALVSIGIMVESVHSRSQSIIPSLRSLEYLKTFVLFFSESKFVAYILAFCGLLAVILLRRPKDLSVPLHQSIERSPTSTLTSILPWLLIGNIFYIYIIGLPRIPYRFGGYNLGPDTALPATWTTALWLIAALLSLWQKNRLTWLAPFLVFALVTNALFFFSFPGYEVRENQKKILSNLYSENAKLPPDKILLIPAENVCFSKGECRVYTIPMLRQIGIISPQRGIAIVSIEEYASRHTAIANAGTLPLLPDKMP